LKHENYYYYYYTRKWSSRWRWVCSWDLGPEQTA